MSTIPSPSIESKIIKIRIQSRFRVEQTDSNAFDVCIPVGNQSILNKEIIERLNLSDREIEDAEYEVLRSIAIIR